MAVLVTGSSGLLGTAAIRQLNESGETVVGFDCQPPRAPIDGVHYVQGDLTNLRDLTGVCQTFSISRVLHLAALVHHLAYREPQTALEINVVGFGHILETARTLHLERVVYASSVIVYGARRSYPGAVDETDLLGPGTLYGATKAMNEASAAHYASAYGVRAVALRPHFSFGPGRYEGSAGQFNAFIRDCATGKRDHWNRVFSPGTTLAPLHAEDMAAAFVHALQGTPLPNLLYNVGGLEQLTEDAMIQTVANLTGNTGVSPRAAGAEYNLDLPTVDCSRFVRESGFKHRYDFVSAVEACIAHYRAAAH